MNSQMQHLQRPFSSHEIRERQGRKNMMYKYIPTQFVVDRLNEVGTENWHFHIKESKQIGSEIVVLASLTLFGVTKEAFGSCVIDENRTAGDSFKTAQALALTKTASLFNIPCVFHATSSASSGFSQPQGNVQRQTVGGNRQGTDRSSHQHNSSDKKGCMDCGQVITAAEANFTRSQPQKFQGKELCRACQKNYQHIQRVQ